MGTAKRSAHMLFPVVLLAGGLVAPRFSIAVEIKPKLEQQSKNVKKEAKEPKSSPELQREEGGCRVDSDCPSGSMCWRPDHWSGWSCKRR